MQTAQIEMQKMYPVLISDPVNLEDVTTVLEIQDEVGYMGYELIDLYTMGSRKLKELVQDMRIVRKELSC